MIKHAPKSYAVYDVNDTMYGDIVWFKNLFFVFLCPVDFIHGPNSEASPHSDQSVMLLKLQISSLISSTPS